MKNIGHYVDTNFVPLQQIYDVMRYGKVVSLDMNAKVDFWAPLRNKYAPEQFGYWLHMAGSWDFNGAALDVRIYSARMPRRIVVEVDSSVTKVGSQNLFEVRKRAGHKLGRVEGFCVLFMGLLNYDNVVFGNFSWERVRNAKKHHEPCIGFTSPAYLLNIDPASASVRRHVTRITNYTTYEGTGRARSHDRTHFRLHINDTPIDDRNLLYYLLPDDIFSSGIEGDADDWYKFKTPVETFVSELEDQAETARFRAQLLTVQQNPIVRLPERLS